MGGITPIITKLLIILKTAKRMTINPAVLKKISEFIFLCIESEVKESKARTGKVPKAKKVITNAPSKKEPVESV